MSWLQNERFAAQIRRWQISDQVIGWETEDHSLLGEAHCSPAFNLAFPATSSWRSSAARPVTWPSCAAGGSGPLWPSVSVGRRHKDARRGQEGSSGPGHGPTPLWRANWGRGWAGCWSASSATWEAAEWPLGRRWRKLSRREARWRWGAWKRDQRSYIPSQSSYTSN